MGGIPAAAHLEGLIDKLMGTALGVSGALPDVRKLVGTEPEQVFDVVRARIDQTGSYAGKPDGVDGLVALVREHPVLERRLLGFIRGLPIEKIGAWAPTAWGTCFQDTAVIAEFGEIVRGWSEQTTNTTLQKAAQLTASVKPRRQK
jgi:hypothetical protein